MYLLHFETMINLQRNKNQPFLLTHENTNESKFRRELTWLMYLLTKEITVPVKFTPMKNVVCEKERKIKVNITCRHLFFLCV